jgi:hypothetical protein
MVKYVVHIVTTGLWRVKLADSVIIMHFHTLNGALLFQSQCIK